MNQATHAWLAVEAYRKIAAEAKTPDGIGKKLDSLARLLGQNLEDVVVAAWLPDSLIRDMSYGHVFKNSKYVGEQTERFKLSKEQLTKKLPSDARIPPVAFDLVPDAWWEKPYRVKDNGGHLPARVNALCQTVRDMFRMGDADVVQLTGVSSKGAEAISKDFLNSPRNIAMMLWMLSHYVADAHMPFHSDNRALASTAQQKTHSAIEKLWGEQVPEIFKAETVLGIGRTKILAAKLPGDSHFADLDFGTGIKPLKNGGSGDPWEEAVYICRASFAVSFAWVPPSIASVDDKATAVSLKDILNEDFCGEERFWNISRALMTDAVNAIARFWQDAWVDFTAKESAGTSG